MIETPARPATGALDSALNFLERLAGEGTQPDEALAALRDLEDAHPDLELDLVWDDEPFDRTIHYDLLLHRGARGTVSMSLCPDRGLPWPLRGVQRASELGLVRVNGALLTVADAVAYLDFVWGESRLADRLVNVCLIRQELRRRPIELSADDRRRAVEAFRRTHGLHTPEATAQWLERQGMTFARVEQLATDGLVAMRLRERVTAGLIEPYFAAHQADFATARIARLTVSTEAEAMRIVDGMPDFFVAAEQAFLRSAAEGRPVDELFATIQAGSTPAPLAAVFAAHPGAIVGPVPVDGGFAIVRVLSIEPARLDPTTRQTIQALLFERWLDERRAEASVEWYWGGTQPSVPR